MTTTSAPASCRSWAVAAPIPLAPPTTSARLPSYRNASNRDMSILSSVVRVSADDATDLEVDDGIPVDPQVTEDVVAMLVELRRPPRDGGLLVELDGRGHEPERDSGRRLALLHVPVGDALGVRHRLEGVLHHG